MNNLHLLHHNRDFTKLKNDLKCFSTPNQRNITRNNFSKKDVKYDISVQTMHYL